VPDIEEAFVGMNPGLNLIGTASLKLPDVPTVTGTFFPVPPADDYGLNPPVILEPGAVWMVGNKSWTLQSMMKVGGVLQLTWSVKVVGGAEGS
jgi:hypothetical protein